jgi:nucleotide-binding universal stress UspA family protein
LLTAFLYRCDAACVNLPEAMLRVTSWRYGSSKIKVRIRIIMAIKDILVALAPRADLDPARDYALGMASAHRAHVTAAAYPIIPDVPKGLYPQFVSGLVKQCQDEADAAVKAARATFENAAANAGVSHGFHGFCSSVRAATTDFATRLRTADIAVLTQHADEIERVGDLFIEEALLRSGRPIIVVPRGNSAAFSTERVLIAWDGSIHATRAVAGAMSLLERASIKVFTVEEAPKGDFRGSALVDHLRRHGLDAHLAQRNEADAANTIVGEAESFRATLVVMGGYGHSRLREFVFGGATRAMLRNMPAPVLMAH